MIRIGQYRHITRRAMVALVLLAMHAVSAQAVTIPTVPIGNAGNSADSRIMSDGTSGYGGVAYNYRVGATEVTNAQYVEFLNAVAATDTYGLYSILMNLDSRGGITRSGSSGSYVYSVKSTVAGVGPGGSDYAYAAKPVVFVSSGDAMRFANWLHNGQPVGPQDAGTTEDGAYTLSGATSNAALLAVGRNLGAAWVLTSEDEWHKAAYYDGNSATYYDYPTASNVIPDNNLPSADSGNSANFYQGGFTAGDNTYPLTDAGAYTQSASPYDTLGQAGNVAEWNESVINGGRAMRGGGWTDSSQNQLASHRGGYLFATSESHSIGFRVANVPEPASFAISLMALAGLIACRWTRSRSNLC